MEKHPFYSKNQIAAYLNGNMSEAQAEAFENLLDNDPFFEAIVEGMRLQKVAKQMLKYSLKINVKMLLLRTRLRINQRRTELLNFTTKRRKEGGRPRSQSQRGKVGR